MKYLSVFLLAVLAFSSCAVEKYQHLNGYAQGTTFSIIYKSSENYDVDIFEMLKKFDQTLSIYDSTSMISKINRNEPNIELNDIFKTFFDESYSVYKKSDGYFDITVGPLVNAWGFGVKGKITADSSKIDSIKALVGMDKIKIIDNRLVKSDPRIYIDANAIAQGQSVDYVCDFFEKEGVEDYMVEIGGEVRAKGVNEKGNVWKIGIDKPIEGTSDVDQDLQAIVNLKSKALSTSGNYRKFHEWKGIKYSHSINPKTGYPSRDVILSASIIADKCAIADAFATACMVMGFEKAKVLLEQNKKDIDAYLIYAGDNANFQVYQTKGFDKYLDKEENKIAK